MAGQLRLLLLLSLFTIGSLAQSLVAVLRQEGFSEFAAIVEETGINATDSRRLIVYAPTDAALRRRQLAGGLLARGENDTTADAKSTVELSMVSQPTGDLRRRTNSCSSVPGPGAVDFMSLLSNPEYVNLPLGNNASVVQKNMPKGALPVVHSGLGDTVKVTGLDIPFDNGVIRPVSEFLTLPRLLSFTLPFLSVDKTLDILTRTGLIDEFNTIPGITFLAPDDRVIPADLDDEVLAEVMRRHLIVKLPIFTSDLKHGDTYPTLAGTTVTVTINCGDVFLNGARILAGDAIVKNGVVHTVDKLLDIPVFVTKTTTEVQTITETKTQTTQIVETVESVTTETVKSTQSTTLTETEKETVEFKYSTTATLTTTIIPHAPPPKHVTITKSTIIHPPQKTVTYSHPPPPPKPVESNSWSTPHYYVAPKHSTFSKATKHYTKDH